MKPKDHIVAACDADAEAKAIEAKGGVIIERIPRDDGKVVIIYLEPVDD